MMSKRTGERASCYVFGDLMLDTATRRVTRKGSLVELNTLTFDLLRVLVEAAPEVVSFDDLAERVWQRRFVSPTTVAQRVKLLRRSLADDGRASRYIESVRGRGYRFKADVYGTSAGAAASTDQPAAYDWYLRALDAFTVQAPQQGFEYADRALGIDPEFPEALGLKAVALARSLINADAAAPPTTAQSGIEAEALKLAAAALRLDPRTSLAWVARAMIHTLHWRWDQAREAYSAALALNSRDTAALEPYACFNIFVGAVNAAIEAARLIRAIDPDNAMGKWLEGKGLSAADRHEEALSAYEDAVGSSPVQVLLQRSVGDANVRIGRFDEAGRAFRTAERLLVGHPSRGVWLPSLAYGYAMIDQHEDAERLLGEYDAGRCNSRAGAGDRLLVSLARRDEEAALKWLGTAARNAKEGQPDAGLWPLIEIRYNYLADPLLEQRRFREAIGLLGLEQLRA